MWFGKAYSTKLHYQIQDLQTNINHTQTNISLPKHGYTQEITPKKKIPHEFFLAKDFAYCTNSFGCHHTPSTSETHINQPLYMLFILPKKIFHQKKNLSFIRKKILPSPSPTRKVLFLDTMCQHIPFLFKTSHHAITNLTLTNSPI